VISETRGSRWTSQTIEKAVVLRTTWWRTFSLHIIWPRLASSASGRINTIEAFAMVVLFSTGLTMGYVLSSGPVVVLRSSR